MDNTRLDKGVVPVVQYAGTNFYVAFSVKIKICL